MAKARGLWEGRGGLFGGDDWSPLVEFSSAAVAVGWSVVLDVVERVSLCSPDRFSCVFVSLGWSVELVENVSSFSSRGRSSMSREVLDGISEVDVVCGCDSRRLRSSFDSVVIVSCKCDELLEVLNAKLTSRGETGE